MTATSIYNVLDYGAVGDGVHDDAAAINAALAASVTQPNPGGGMCYIPDGTFLLKAETLSLPASTHLLIDGTVILAADVAIDILTVGGSGILIEGIGTLDGNSSNQTAANTGIAIKSGVAPVGVAVHGLTIQDTSGPAVALVNVTNGTLDGLTFSNNTVRATIGNGCSNCRATNLTVSGGGDIGLAFYDGATACGVSGSWFSGNATNIAVVADAAGSNACSHITIANNTCAAATGSSPGIAILSVSGTTHSAITITGNETYGNGGGGIALSAVSDCTVSSNNCHDDTGVEIAVGSSTTTAACSLVSVVDNTCAASSTTGTVGISVAAASGTIHTDLNVSGNTCTGNPGGGIAIAQVTGCVVSGNLCAGDTGTEVTIGGASSTVNVTGNNCNDVVADSSGSGVGIAVADTVAQLTVFHNHIWSSGTGMTYCITGGPNNDTYIHGNFLGGWTTAASDYNTSGTNFQQSANTVPLA